MNANQQKVSVNSMNHTQQQLSQSQYLLYYYNIDCIQQLIDIMIDPQKSFTYNYIRNHPIPHIQLQNLSTIKATIQYKRRLLIEGIYNVKQQVKQKLKTKLHKSNSSSQITKQFQDNCLQKQRYSSSSNSNQYNNKKIYRSIMTRKSMDELDIVATSNHSYEELQNYFVKNNDAQLCKKILQEKYTRLEVIQSHRIRKSFWLLLIGINRKREQYPDMYETLSIYKNYHDFFSRIILADVVRTIHEVDENIQKIQIDKMYKILLNFARRNPYIGYCQGMNFILQFIMRMDFKEEECFWILVTVLEEIAEMGYYTDMTGVAIDIKILSYILMKLNPEIHRKLTKIEIDLSVFVLEWLVCLYTSTIPFPMLFLVWDKLLIQGSIVLLKVAIVLLEQLAPIIQQAKDFNHFFKLYENLKRSIYIQEEEFMEKLNNLYIDQKILTLVREIIQKQLRKTKQQLCKKMTYNEKWKQLDCSIEWPICFQQLKKQKLNDLQIDIWVLKDENKPKIITDYLNPKQKRSTKPAQDNRINEKKLVIGRMPHICQSNLRPQRDNKKKIEEDGIELDVIQQVVEGDEVKKKWRNYLLYRKQQQSSTEFYHRATQNSMAFHILSSI